MDEKPGTTLLLCVGMKCQKFKVGAKEEKHTHVDSCLACNTISSSMFAVALFHQNMQNWKGGCRVDRKQAWAQLFLLDKSRQ